MTILLAESLSWADAVLVVAIIAGAYMTGRLT